MKSIILALIIALLPLSGFTHELAITFDDLPGQGEYSVQMNQAILDVLKEYKAPAIGFVNEEKVSDTRLLKIWVDQGYPLGNHTYSHQSMHQIPLEDYKQEVIKGSLLSKVIMSDAGMHYMYFRHPYLHAGITRESRSNFQAFLKNEGYTIAPATIDTDDYVFNDKLIQNPKEKEKIIQSYLDHTRAKFEFYEQASNAMFSRNIKHIWLLHVNQLNASCMEELLKIANDFGYKFITLDQALTDPAYASEDNYYQNYGVSWLYRWDYTRGKVVDWSKEPEPSL